MTKNLPNKWIRKAIATAINNIVVDGITIPCYDTRVTADVNSDIPNHYILMTSQSNEVDKNNKCAYNWQSQIVLDIVTIYDLPGNPGSRLLSDNILEAVKNNTNNLVLDVASSLTILTQNPSFPNDIISTTKTQNVYRKLMRIEFYIV